MVLTLSKDQLLTSESLVLDEALGGGLRGDDILHIVGPGGVGKTTLALQFTINVARNGNRVFYVNLGGKFPLLRLKQMASTDFNQITPLITVVSPITFHEQSQLVGKLETLISPDVRLLVFDTIVSLYRKEYGKNSDNITLNRKLNQQLGILVSFVKSRFIPVIIINQVRGDIEGENNFQPVANSIVSYWSTCSIQITKAESKGYREFKLTKRHEGEPKTFVLQLQSLGFR